MLRRFLLALLLGLTTLFAPVFAWPERPAAIIAPFGPGTSVDIVARLLAPRQQAAWGQQVAVLNVPGAAGIIGVDRAVRANNGHALLLSADAAIGVRISMAPRPPHDPRRDLAPITLIGRTTNILVVGNNQPIQNLADLVALARTRPGTVTFGHAGHGTSQHVGGEMLAQMAGVELTGIACNETASQINDVMTGRVTMSFQSGVVAPPRLRGNAWRAIAVLAPARLAALPNVPTVAELGYPGFGAVVDAGGQCRARQSRRGGGTGRARDALPPR